VVAVRPKPPFRPVFRVAASRDGSDIRIINEPPEGSFVFLVETGESRTLSETRLEWFISVFPLEVASKSLAFQGK